ncbi:MAG: Asd/ArgC dimerization domain-containing protein, partial [Acidobacteria bacterium]|nr:Asd/ArgC dimerization domain-containing protein [Acidobacteriota bacterium]
MKKPVITIVGGETLLGRELRDVLAGGSRQAEVRLIGTLGEGVGILTAQEDEAGFITPLEQQALADAVVSILAGAPDASRKAVALAGDLEHPPALVDCTHALEDQPPARLRAPLAEPGPSLWPAGTIHVVAHPAATALAMFFKQLRQSSVIRQSVVHVFEPASERGQAGIDELQRQTVNLLSFKTLPKDVYDTQVSFNLIARYGEEAKESLGSIQSRLERHLASLLAQLPGVPMPSLRLIQAPVFHGYTFSLWVEFEEAPSPEALAELLDTPFIEVRGADVEAPSNVVLPPTTRPWWPGRNWRRPAEARLEASASGLAGGLLFGRMRVPHVRACRPAAEIDPHHRRSRLHQQHHPLPPYGSPAGCDFQGTGAARALCDHPGSGRRGCDS